jgi:hypothetical protein
LVAWLLAFVCINGRLYRLDDCTIGFALNEMPGGCNFCKLTCISKGV